jgi:hypothetical protein
MPEKRLSDEITVVAGLAAGVSNYARGRGIDIAPICKALEIDPGNFGSLTERISLDRLCRLLETCALISGDDAFGLQCASTFPAGVRCFRIWPDQRPDGAGVSALSSGSRLLCDQ